MSEPDNIENASEVPQDTKERWYVLKMFDLAVKDLYQDPGFAKTASNDQIQLLEWTRLFVNLDVYKDELKNNPKESEYEYEPVSTFFESMVKKIAKNEKDGMDKLQIENSKKVLKLMRDFSSRLGDTKVKQPLKDVLRASLSHK